MKEPKIRFKGFKGEWEDPTIANTFAIRNGYTPSKAIKAFWDGGTIPWFRMEDIRENGGILKDAIQHITPLGVKGDGLFETNSIILATTATIGVHAMLIADSLANQQFTNFSIRKSLKDNYNPMFVYYSFFGIDEWCKKNTNSGGLLAVNIPYLLKQSFHTPILPEQQSIASYFQHLDSLIQSTTKKIESLKQVKTASLQSMFPQEGETTPRVRFKGFEGEWEKVSFGQFGSVAMCKRIFKDQTMDKGEVPFYKIGTFAMEPDAYISKELFIEYKSKFSFPQKGDILISAAGTIGRTIQYNGEDAYFQDSNIVWLKHGNEIDNTFLMYIYSLVKWNGLEGATIKRLYNNIILETEFLLPPVEEQRAIASFFTILDRQITLQTQRLEKLKQIKAACLDKMFV